MGRAIGQGVKGVKTSTNGIQRLFAVLLKSSNLPLLRLFPYSIETQEHAGAGGTEPPMSAVAVWCLSNNDSSFSQQGLPRWIENSKVLRRIYPVWASLARVERSFKC